MASERRGDTFEPLGDRRAVATRRLPVDLGTGKVDLGAAGVEGFGQIQRCQRAVVTALVQVALGFSEQRTGDGLQTTNTLFAAERHD